MNFKICADEVQVSVRDQLDQTELDSSQVNSTSFTDS